MPISLSTLPPPATPLNNFLYSSKFKNILAGLELCTAQLQLVFPILSAIIMRQIVKNLEIIFDQFFRHFSQFGVTLIFLTLTPEN